MKHTDSPFMKNEPKTERRHTPKRNYLTYIWILAAAGWIASCSPRPQADDRTLYVSILPLRSLVCGIVGDDFDVEVLVPAGASPETFEPTARQIGDLNRSALIFNVGLIDFETTLIPKIAAAEKVVNLSEGIELLEGSCAHDHTKAHRNHADGDAEHTHNHEHAHGIDPHIWTSPKALQRMAANAYEAIRRMWPDSTHYAERYARLRDELAALDRRTEEKLAASGTEYFIIYHPAYTYYAHDYGLRQEAIEADGKEPSARRIAAMIREAREKGVRRIFRQRQFPASTAETIARDIDAEVIEVDPLQEDVIGGIDAFTEQLTKQ